eukprot:scaffold481_cov208-Cylindrotheca_fusiformis.AAC.12
MRIIEQIEANSITEITLSQDADEISDNVNIIIDALRKNESLVSIRLEEHFLGELRNDSRRQVLEAIGLIPTLKRVHLGNSLLVVNGITKMLCEATSLCELSLGEVLLQGIQQDFNALEAALHSHPALKVFTMEACTPAIRGISLEPLAKSTSKSSAISSPMPNMKTALTA